MPKLKTIVRSVIGEYKKLILSLPFIKVPIGINTEFARDKKIIVSLTSYGRRVTKLVYYTIDSIMRQTMKPDKIILWLDSYNWNRNNIPCKLKKLESKGLEILFCKDIKSYKKLIPALKKFPDDLIITIDDDVYYEPTIIEELVNAYNKNSNSIQAFLTSSFLFDKMDNTKCYWCGEGFTSKFDFATGVGAILYDSKLLYKDILNESLFNSLAPLADDLWFYFMEYLNGTHVNMVRSNKNKMSFYPLDSFYQKLNSKSSLNATNLHMGKNNDQIKAIMEYYNISLEDLITFSKSNPYLRDE